MMFTFSNSSKYTPRAVLIDLEPSVINKSLSTLPIFNPRNVHLSESGSGAANNWKNGYSYGLQHQNNLIDLIDREMDKCDNLSTFQFFHSVAGGTGAGVGSLLLELLNDRYGNKKLVTTFLIFPSNEKTSDVVVQPYNTVLTLKRLIDYSDCTFVFHNDALNSIETMMINNDQWDEKNFYRSFNNENLTNSTNDVNSNFDLNFNGNKQNFENANLHLHEKKTAFIGANKLVSHVLANVSNPLRFPNYMYSSFESIFSSLIPIPDLKFITSSIEPFINFSSKKVELSEYDIILELLNDKYKMNRVDEHIKHISIMNYLIGNHLDQLEIKKGLIKAQTKVDFVPWTPPVIQMINGKKSPYLNSKKNNKNKDIIGIQISNNTSVAQVFSKILKQYDLLAKREAYINSYIDSNNPEEKQMVLDSFNESKESIIGIIEEYKLCQNKDYCDFYFLNEHSDSNSY